MRVCVYVKASLCVLLEGKGTLLMNSPTATLHLLSDGSRWLMLALFAAGGDATLTSRLSISIFSDQFQHIFSSTL